MANDPSMIKPYADYHNKNRLVIVQPAAFVKEGKPAPRSWKVSQCSPLLQNGLVRNGTRAVELLNLSKLPGDAPPEQCLAWARSFCQAIEGGLDVETAARTANNNILTGEGDQSK